MAIAQNQHTAAAVEHTEENLRDFAGPSDVNPASAVRNEPEVPSPTSWNAKERQRVKRHPPHIEGQDHGDQNVDSVRLNLRLIALPTAIGLVNIFYYAGIVAVALVCTASLVMSSASARIRLSGAALILPAIGAVVALRPNISGGITNAIFFVLACIAVPLTLVTSSSRPSAVVSLFDGIGLLLLAAVAFKAAGFGGTGARGVIMGNIFTGGERAEFSLIGSVTMAPTIAAVYLVAVIPVIKNFGKHRGYRLIGAGIALYVLVQSDRRSPMFALILISLMIVLTPRLLRQFAPWIVGILLIQPFLLKLFEPIVDRAAFSAFAQSLPFQRTASSGAAADSVGPRLEIWSSALDFYQDRVDWFHQAFGFGTFGQAKSGASMTYRHLFFGEPGSATKTAHNSALQTLFDAGWIGVAGFLFAVVWAARILSRRHSPADLALLAMLVTLSFGGSTEALLSPGYVRSTPWWILLAITAIAFSEENPKVEQTTDRPKSAKLQYKLHSGTNTRSTAG